jgi:hypothetical protein
MLDDVVKVFIKRLKDLVITDEKMTTIPLAYLATLELPASVSHFLDQQVELWLRKEEEKFESTDRFDYDQPEVRMHIDQIFDLLKQNATFDINRFNQLLERAIKLELNYLIEPHRTLKQFIFKDSHKVSTMEVYDTLKYFFRYEYYKTAISDYFNTKYLREIEESQFAELMRQIDEKAFSENKVDTTLKTLKTIMSFLGDAKIEEITSLSVDVLIATFKDRNLEDYLAMIERVKDETDLEEITFDQIEDMLRNNKIPGIVEVEEVEEVEEEEKVGFEEVEDIETSQPEVKVDDIEVSEVEPIPEEEEEEIEEEEEEEEEIEEEVEEEVVKQKGNVASQLASVVASQIQSDTPLEDLNKMITKKIAKKAVKKLFKKKEQDYLTFITSLNELSQWTDASALIDDEFYNREINPYSKEAIALTDVIYTRFFPKDKYVGDGE